MAKKVAGVLCTFGWLAASLSSQSTPVPGPPPNSSHPGWVWAAIELIAGAESWEVVDPPEGTGGYLAYASPTNAHAGKELANGIDVWVRCEPVPRGHGEAVANLSYGASQSFSASRGVTGDLRRTYR